MNEGPLSTIMKGVLDGGFLNGIGTDQGCNAAFALRVITK
jgi:hypothetical protein